MLGAVAFPHLSLGAQRRAAARSQQLAVAALVAAAAPYAAGLVAPISARPCQPVRESQTSRRRWVGIRRANRAMNATQGHWQRVELRILMSELWTSVVRRR